VLVRRKKDAVNRTVALAVTGLILFITANAFPFLTFKMEADFQETTLLTGIVLLYRQGLWGLAVLVFFTTVLAPLVQIVGMLYTMAPLQAGRRAPAAMWVLRNIRQFQPWGMMEVYMLGILVSLAKLAKMATIVPGVAVFAFMALIFTLAAMMAVYDPHQIWADIERIS
jgi:paraquat-inducible protein A